MTGDTFFAVRRHAGVDPLRHPGEADLSAHVDFRALAVRAAAAGVVAFGPLTQGAYLRRLGIGQRLATLLRGATPAQAEALESGCARLVGEEAMGSLFKVLALAPPDAPVPPGFTDAERRR